MVLSLNFGPHSLGLKKRFKYDIDDDDDVVVGSESNDFYCACENGTLFPQKHGKQGKGGEMEYPLLLGTKNWK